MKQTTGLGPRDDVEDLVEAYDCAVQVIAGEKEPNEFDHYRELQSLTGIDRVLKKLEIDVTGESNKENYSACDIIGYLKAYSGRNEQTKINIPGDKKTSKNGMFLRPEQKHALEDELSDMIQQYQGLFEKELDTPYSNGFSFQLKERDPKANTMQWLAAGLMAYISTDKELAQHYGASPAAKAEVRPEKKENGSYINLEFSFKPPYKH